MFKIIKNVLVTIYWECQNFKVGWPGGVAKKYGYPVGRIGCPHCGIGLCGALDSPECGWCGKNYWEKPLEEPCQKK